MSWIKQKIKRFWKWLIPIAIATPLIISFVGDVPVQTVKIGDVLGKREIMLPDFDTKGRPVPNTEKLVFKYAYVAGRMNENIPDTIRNSAKGLTILSEVLEKRTDGGRIFKTDKEGVFVGEFISGEPQYYKDDDGLWWQANYATSTPENFSNLPKSPLYKRVYPISYLVKNVFAVTGTFYPDPNIETSTVDGLVFRSGVNETFTTIIDGAGTGSGDSATTQGLQIETSGTSNQFITIARHIYLFDTSSIGDTDTINSATLSLMPNSFFGNTNNKLNISSSTPNSNTALVNGDYGQTGKTKFSTGVLFSSMSAGTYTDFALNASGLAEISKTGISKFSGKQEDDLDRAFSPSWAGNQEWGVVLRMADYADTTSDPKLVVVYTTSVAAAVSSFMPIIIDDADD